MECFPINDLSEKILNKIYLRVYIISICVGRNWRLMMKLIKIKIVNIYYVFLIEAQNYGGLEEHN